MPIQVLRKLCARTAMVMARTELRISFGVWPNESFPELRALARLEVDLIVTRGTPAAIGRQGRTTTIPVVRRRSAIR